jgi:hypothetical protein
MKKCKNSCKNNVENQENGAIIAEFNAIKKSPNPEKDSEIKDLKIKRWDYC